MKLKTAVLVLSVLLATMSCRKNTQESMENTTTTEVEKEDKVSDNDKRIKDCDDFLDTYESWTNELIELMAKHKDDPVTLATSPEYMNTMLEGVSFVQDWETIAYSCASNDTYSKRMEAIQQRLENKQKELGLK